MPEVQDEIIEEQESKPNCEKCNDTGFIEDTEWSGEDDSYPVTKRCSCNQD